MAKAPQISTRRIAISKTNAQMVAIVAVAAFITVFCLVASKAVFSQNRYQARVISKKEDANNTLKKNLETFNDLQTSYQAFDSTATNAIGGNSSGTGDNDGSNSKIVLDALPSNYDFPALTSSIEKIVKDNNLKITNITGTDDQVSQQNNQASPDPKTVSIPFSFTVSNANYSSISQLVTKLQQSIRPIQINTIELSGGINDMTATINAQTYFQPARNVNITKEVVK